MNNFVRNLSFFRGDTPIFQNMNIAFPHKGVICLQGPSGCGKSTLLRLFCGLEQPTEGTISFCSSKSVVFQDNVLLPWLTVEENVALPLQKEEKIRVTQALEAVELTQFAHLFPKQLSGGMARRVAIARALAYDGEVLLLDEPFNGLNCDLRERIAEHIRRQYNTRLVVLITHQLAEAQSLNADIIPWIWSDVPKTDIE